MSIRISDKDIEDWVRKNPHVVNTVLNDYDVFLAQKDQQESDARRQVAMDKIATWEPDLQYDDTKTARENRQKAYWNIQYLEDKKQYSESSEETDEIRKRIITEEQKAKKYKGAS